MTHMISDDAMAATVSSEAERQSGLDRRGFLKMAAALSGGVLAVGPLSTLVSEAAKKPAAESKSAGVPTSLQPTSIVAPGPSVIEAKSFETHFATIEGISQNQLKQHLGLYQNYVKKINEIQTTLATMTPDLAKANGTYDPFRELHVEQSFALNGVVLHELYFENLGGSRAAASDKLKGQVARQFGSWAEFMTRLKALAKCMRGWAMMGYNLRDGKIHLYGMDSHNQWVPIHVVPLLLLDVFEHAYMIDFGTNRGAYLDAFMANVNWEPVERRLEMAMNYHEMG